MTRGRILEIAIIVLFVGQILIGVGTYVNTRSIDDEARRGSIAYRAECTYVGDLKTRVSQAERFLAMTVPEREAAFGKVLGSIPPATIRVQVANERRAIKSLKELRCS